MYFGEGERDAKREEEKAWFHCAAAQCNNEKTNKKHAQRTMAIIKEFKT